MRRAALMAALAILATAQPGFAQPSEDLQNLRKEIEVLKEGQKTIQSDLQEIKNLLRARPPEARAPTQEAVVSVDGAPFKGSKTAKVTLVEFTDYQ